MPTAVLDIEFNHLPHEITGLERYSHALVLLRLHGKPVAQTRLPIINGLIRGTDLRTALADAASWFFWENWLYHYLEWEPQISYSTSLPTVTIATCTRDRPDDLKHCLEGILGLPDDGQEILIVDNAPSTDETRRLVEQFPTVRYVCEPRPGLNNARNRALYEARTEIVAFIDDDATPDQNWLRALLKNYADPFVMCVTGQAMPLELETEAQEWFERYISFMRGFKRRVFENVY